MACWKAEGPSGASIGSVKGSSSGWSGAFGMRRVPGLVERISYPTITLCDGFGYHQATSILALSIW
jgi:hypothetical protein